MVTTLGPAGVYLFFVLGAAGVAGVTFKVVQYINKERSKHESKRSAKKRTEYLKKVKQFENSMGKEKTEVSRIEFTSNLGNQTSYTFEEIINFDETRYKLYRGVLTCYLGQDKQPEVREIYLFQPRLLFRGATTTTEIVPNDLKGQLIKGHEYQYRTNGSTEIFTGYTPKREVLTGDRFDYVEGEYRSKIDGISKDDQKEKEELDSDVRSIVVIDIPKDANGNLVPVNLQDPQEKAAFEAYKEKHVKQDPTMSQYSNALYQIIRRAKAIVKGGYTRRTKGEDLDLTGVRKEPEKKSAPKKDGYTAIDSYKRYQDRDKAVYDMQQKVNYVHDMAEASGDLPKPPTVMTPPPPPDMGAGHGMRH